MPMPKQVLLRLARQVSDPSWMWRYALLLIGVGVLQAVLAAWLGPPVLRWVFPQAAESLHKAIMLLVAVPALRALYELQTIAHDRTQALEQLMRRTAVAALVLAGVAVAIGYLEGILAFYLVLVALCAAAILRPRQPRRPSSPTRRLS
jgi:O-antigen/teichoic acid export membrane protein